MSRVKLEPSKITVKIGSSDVELKAIIEDPIPGVNYEFQWFKSTEKNLFQSIPISENSTAKSNKLVFKELTVDDEAKYTCQISDGCNKVLRPKPIKVKVLTESPYDLKMALLIGNGQYQRFNCNDCDATYLKYENLTVEKSLVDLKQLLESNDFIVTVYLDLEAENFLRVVRLFKEKCMIAKNVLAFIYIGAHGFHKGVNDFAVPIDFQNILHANDHQLRFHSSALSFCTLGSLLKNFTENPDDNQPDNNTEQTKFSVVCFWDLSRENINFPVDSDDSENYKDLQYTIIYSCVGRSAYELKNVGSIMLNLFIEQFKKNWSLNDLLEAVEKKNRELKKKYPILQRNESLRVYNVLGQPCILSHKAKRTAQYRGINEDIYFKSFNNKTEMAHELPNGEIFRYSYRFIKDDFVNTILLEISQEKTFYPIYVRSLNEELRIDEIHPSLTYRLRGIQNLKPIEPVVDNDPSSHSMTRIQNNGSLNCIIEIEFFKNQAPIKSTISLPLSALILNRKLHSDSIDEYIEKLTNSFNNIFASLDTTSIRSSDNGDNASDIEPINII